MIVLTHLFFFKIFLKIFNLNLCILISKKKIFGIYINRKSLVQILDKNFESHAWIEFKGKKILNILPDIDQFKVIHSYE